jgi:hypothetical protein
MLLAPMPASEPGLFSLASEKNSHRKSRDSFASLDAPPDDPKARLTIDWIHETTRVLLFQSRFHSLTGKNTFINKQQSLTPCGGRDLISPLHPAS